MYIIVFILSILIFYLLFVISSQKKQMQQIILLLKNFSNQEDIDIPITENFDSHVAMLLKYIQTQHICIEESSRKDRDKLQILISDLSHQLKTPLTNLKMYQCILDDDDLTPNEIQKFKEKLKIQISKIEWIVHSLINCMGLEENTISFSVESLPIHATILEAIESVQFSAELKNIQITLSEQFNQKISVIHNLNWTREIFINILENAIKYSDYNSEIVVNIYRTELYSIISITDFGIGIKKHELNKIFQRFYRSPEVSNIEGNGIGLYLSRLISEKENGYITVESTYKNGTTFNIWLPNSF